MQDLYKTNNIYKAVSCWCILRKKTIAQMCKEAEISPGIITDLKMGRKQNIQVNTAQKIANALDVPLQAILNFQFDINRHWSLDAIQIWYDSDTDTDRAYILEHFGVDYSYAGREDLREDFVNAILVAVCAENMSATAEAENENRGAATVQTENSLNADLLRAFNQLNEQGQQKAVERVEELTEIPKYKQSPSEE